MTSAYEQPLAHGDARADEEHHPPSGNTKYLVVFACLVVLTGMSYLTYFPVWDAVVSSDPRVKWAFMMAVSCTKAMLVILFFMHVLWEANWKYVLTIPAALMSIFLILMLVPDIGFRVSHYSRERWLYAAEPRPTFGGLGVPHSGDATGAGHGPANEAPPH